jgi:hypothetical protein
MNTVTIDEKEHVNTSTNTNTSIGSNYKNNSNDHVKLENIQKNKPLMKLLILVNREKIKKEWEECRKFMTYWLVNKMLLKGDFNFKESISTVTPTRSATSTIMNAGTEDDFSPARTMDMNKIIECWTSDNKNNNDNNNYSGTNSKGSIQISENDLIVHLEHLTQANMHVDALLIECDLSGINQER